MDKTRKELPQKHIIVKSLSMQNKENIERKKTERKKERERERLNHK
jgi:hypothetical protein